MISSLTSSAAARITTAMVAPNERSPPIASTGILKQPRATNDAVVDGILVERRELREAGPHCSGPRVELRVVAPRCFGKARGIRREFEPETVEIDALTPGHQPFHVRAAEAEVPQ